MSQRHESWGNKWCHWENHEYLTINKQLTFSDCIVLSWTFKVICALSCCYVICVNLWVLLSWQRPACPALIWRGKVFIQRRVQQEASVSRFYSCSWITGRKVTMRPLILASESNREKHQRRLITVMLSLPAFVDIKKHHHSL